MEQVGDRLKNDHRWKTHMSDCLRMEFRAQCGEASDLQLRDVVDETTRGKFTFLGYIESYCSSNRRLYIQGRSLSRIPAEDKVIELSQEHPGRNWIGVIRIEEPRPDGDGFSHDEFGMHMTHPSILSQ